MLITNMSQNTYKNVLVTINKKCKHPKYSPIREWTSKFWSVFIIEYYETGGEKKTMKRSYKYP